VARRGTRAEQYFAVAAFYGVELVESLGNPNIPEFVLVQRARRAAHYALTAMLLEEKRARKAKGHLFRSSWAASRPAESATVA